MLQAAPITGAVLLISGTWYVLSAHKHYKGPRARPHEPAADATPSEGKGEKTPDQNDSESSEEIHPVEP
jgi:hypothetical protein